MTERNNDTPFGFVSRDWLGDKPESFEDDHAGRDPERIDVALTLLEDYWRENPDIRLGQIVVCAHQSSHNTSNNDPFYMEDDVLIDYLRKKSDRPVVVQCPECDKRFATHDEHEELGSYCECGHGFHGGVLDE